MRELCASRASFVARKPSAPTLLLLPARSAADFAQASTPSTATSGSLTRDSYVRRKYFLGDDPCLPPCLSSLVLDGDNGDENVDGGGGSCAYPSFCARCLLSSTLSHLMLLLPNLLLIPCLVASCGQTKPRCSTTSQCSTNARQRLLYLLTKLSEADAFCCLCRLLVGAALKVIRLLSQQQP